MPLTETDFRPLTSPPDLPGELRRLLRQIPVGRVTSFGDLAEALGDLQAARWVATELQELDPDEFPVHRVVRRTGDVPAGKPLPLKERIARLRREGIAVAAERIDLGSTIWREYTGSRPLAALRELQRRVAAETALPALVSLPPRLAGVDVSYGADDVAVAGYTIVETATGRLLHQETHTDRVPFPYVPGYLSFRELPLYARLLERVRAAGRLEPWVLVDGNGILHPRRAGIATMLGCALGVNTVGVSKHLLCGKIDDRSNSPAEIRDNDGMLLGYCVHRGTKRSTLYVSPGVGVDLSGALRLVQSVSVGHRLPEPLYHADRISRIAARAQ
jgi:deoxyribonuclease V